MTQHDFPHTLDCEGCHEQEELAAVKSKTRPEDQPLPTVNQSGFIQDMVIADIEGRRKLGIQRYGSALQANNGRDALQDLYEELIDACMYIKQEIVERDQRASGC